MRFSSASAAKHGEITITRLDQSAFTAADHLLATYLPGYGLGSYLDERSRVLGAFDNGVLVACLHWTVRSVMWHGRRAVIAQTGPGATSPSHRGFGVMRRLVLAALEQMRACGISLAGQETPAVGYHRRTGWEIATFARCHTANSAVLAALPRAGGIVCRQATPDDSRELAAFWDRMNARRTFSSVRADTDWGRLLDRDDWLLAIDTAGVATGYARVTNLDRSPLRVTELVACDVDGARAMLRRLAGSTAAPAVQWWTPPGGAGHFVVADPREISATDEIDKLVRVVDVTGVLANVVDRATTSLCVRVYDDLCSWNDATFVVEANGNVAKTVSRAADLNLHIRAVAALVTCAVDIDALLAARLLGPDSVRALRYLVRDTSGAAAPWYPDDL